MKALEIALIILVFNVMLSGLAHVDLFDNSGVYYESSYYTAYNDSLPANVSAIDETQQYTINMDIIGVIFGTLSWNWIYQFVPLEMHNAISWFVNGLNIISALIISIAFIEMFTKRDII